MPSSNDAIFTHLNELNLVKERFYDTITGFSNFGTVLHRNWLTKIIIQASNRRDNSLIIFPEVTSFQKKVLIDTDLKSFRDSLIQHLHFYLRQIVLRVLKQFHHLKIQKDKLPPNHYLQRSCWLYPFRF